MNLEIRALALADLELLIEWAAQEGWNPGWNDAPAFYAADPEGFLGGFIGNDLVTGISAVRYGNLFGFIGLFITRSDVRFQGHGRAIWKAGMQHLEGRTIGLDGVPQQQRNYQSKGFQPKHGSTRYSGPVNSADARDVEVQEIQPEIVLQIHDFDRKHFPGGRDRFLKEWISVAHAARVCIQDGQITGYGIARRCREGYKIGPLFAGNVDIAISLVRALGNACDGEVHIDVPDYQKPFIAQLQRLGLESGFSTTRMYFGSPPRLAEEGVFAITSPELG